MKGDSTLRFECNGLGLENFCFGKRECSSSVLYVLEDASRMKDLVEGCPLKPCVYRRIAPNVVKRNKPRETAE